MTKKTPANRARPVHKAITFSRDEWTRVQRRQELTGVKDFATFARQTLLDGEVRVRRIAFDPAALRVELSRIGNNINQIARRVNTEEVVTYEEMRAARMLIQQVQAAITAAIQKIEDEA